MVQAPAYLGAVQGLPAKVLAGNLVVPQAEGEGLEPPCGFPRRISSARPFRSLADAFGRPHHKPNPKPNRLTPVQDVRGRSPLLAVLPQMLSSSSGSSHPRWVKWPEHPACSLACVWGQCDGVALGKPFTVYCEKHRAIVYGYPAERAP